MLKVVSIILLQLADVVLVMLKKVLAQKLIKVRHEFAPPIAVIRAYKRWIWFRVAYGRHCGASYVFGNIGDLLLAAEANLLEE